MPSTPDIDALWLEYRVAAQYDKTWDRAVEHVELIRRQEMRGSLPTQDDLAGLGVASRGGSPAYWMQQADGPPAWFVRDELGIGTAVNVFDTTRSLARTNSKRRRQYADMLRELAKARKLVKRTVRM